MREVLNSGTGGEPPRVCRWRARQGNAELAIVLARLVHRIRAVRGSAHKIELSRMVGENGGYGGTAAAPRRRRYERGGQVGLIQ